MRLGSILKYCFLYVRIYNPRMCENVLSEVKVWEGYVDKVPFDLKMRKILTIAPSPFGAERPYLRIVVK